MCIWGYVHVNVVAGRDQRCEDPLELELQLILSCLMQVLGIEFGFSAKAAWTLSS